MGNDQGVIAELKVSNASMLYKYFTICIRKVKSLNQWVLCVVLFTGQIHFIISLSGYMYTDWYFSEANVKGNPQSDQSQTSIYAIA